MKRLLFLIGLLCSISVHAQDRLYWFLEGTQAGYKDIKGNTVVAPQFVMAEQFSEGLACAGKGSAVWIAMYGFINTKGEWAIPIQFDAPGSFSGGLANVALKGKWGYINKEGKWEIEPQFQLCYGFVNGYAQAQQNGKWGIIDRKGNFVIEPMYYDVTNVSDGILSVQKEMTTSWEIIDLKGVKQTTKTFSRIKAFNGGMAPARDENDKYGFVSPKGEWVIKPQFNGAEPFSEGLAAVENDDAYWGFIDRTGKMVIKAEFNNSASFKEGIIMTDKGDEYLYLNKKGETILRFPK